MPYSAAEDLLIGDLELHSALDPQKFVQDAADEMDSHLGVRFLVPIDTGNTSTVEPHAILALKRINNHLATGRLILAVAVGGEDDSLHAYGAYLVREALAALAAMIADPEAYLPGAEVRADLPATTGPTIKHQDSESAVSRFYDEYMGVGTSMLPAPWLPES